MPPSSDAKRSLAARQARYEVHQSKTVAFLTGRGLDADVAERFRLGYVEPSELDPRSHWGRMSIPYLTPTGVVQIRFRCIDPHHGAGGDPGTEVTLYNAAATLHGGDVLFLTEGEPDVWAVTTLAGYPAVGIPGSKAWEKHPYWARAFVNFPRLILPADGDEAGRHLATIVAQSLPEVQIVQLPDGEDAGSILARDRAEFLRRCGLDQPGARG